MIIDIQKKSNKKNIFKKSLKVFGTVIGIFYVLPTIARKHLFEHYKAKIDRSFITQLVPIGSALSAGLTIGSDAAFNLGRYGEFNPSVLEFLTCIGLGTITNVASGFYELGRKSQREIEDLRAKNDLYCAYANEIPLTEEEQIRIGDLQLKGNPSLEDIAYKFDIPKER